MLLLLALVGLLGTRGSLIAAAGQQGAEPELPGKGRVVRLGAVKLLPVGAAPQHVGRCSCGGTGWTADEAGAAAGALAPPTQLSLSARHALQNPPSPVTEPCATAKHPAHGPPHLSR